ncbi:hypothetical protein ACFVJK_37495 [Streptomyces sp. NPDC127172]|uniref:hypothetical protein n=1 Tax=Streptomyces sp. NPDC127172 TaxID=3345382 RepID=UPI00363B8847
MRRHAGGIWRRHLARLCRTAPRRGQFYADTAAFTWGLIAPSALEGVSTSAAPKSLAAYASQL